LVTQFYIFWQEKLQKKINESQDNNKMFVKNITSKNNYHYCYYQKITTRTTDAPYYKYAVRPKPNYEAPRRLA